MNDKIHPIPIDKIDDPQIAIRSDLSPEAVEDLTSSIKQVGIIEPLIVRRAGDRFEVIAGHRRLIAATYADLVIVPCLILETDDLHAQTLRLHENLARKDLSPLDWAIWLAQLKQQFKISIAKLAELLKMSEDWVYQRLEINDYPDSLKKALQYNLISFSSARELVKIEDPQKREQYISYAIKGGVTPSLAARWKAEANLTPLPQSALSPSQSQPPPASQGAENPDICEICQQEIKLGELRYVKVHDKCGPQSAT